MLGATLTTNASIALSLSFAVIWQQASPLPATDHPAPGGLSLVCTLVNALLPLTLFNASLNVVLPGMIPWKQGVAQAASSVAIRLVSFRYLSDLSGGGAPQAAAKRARMPRAVISTEAFFIE